MTCRVPDFSTFGLSPNNCYSNHKLDFSMGKSYHCPKPSTPKTEPISMLFPLKTSSALNSLLSQSHSVWHKKLRHSGLVYSIGNYVQHIAKLSILPVLTSSFCFFPVKSISQFSPFHPCLWIQTDGQSLVFHSIRFSSASQSITASFLLKCKVNSRAWLWDPPQSDQVYAFQSYFPL